MRRIAAILAATIVYIVAPAAQADSGSISNVAPTGSGTIQATFNIEWTTICSNCLWYGAAYTRPIVTDCLADIGSIIWVGDLRSGPGSLTATETFYPPNDQAFNICLYFKGPGNPYLVSMNSYWPPPRPAPPPPVTPAPTPAPVPAAQPPTYTLALSSGEGAARAAITNRWKHGKHRRLSCDRASVAAVSCTATWRRGSRRYVALITVTNGARGIIPVVRVRRA